MLPVLFQLNLELPPRLIPALLLKVSEPVVLKSLRDSDPGIRVRALLLCETLISNGIISEGLWNQLRLMTDDFSPDVRYQLALTLGQIRHEGRPQLLAQMLGRAVEDPLMQTAIFSSLGERAGECFVALADDGATRNNSAGLDLLRRLALMIGTKGSMDEVSPVLDWLDRNSSDQTQTNTFFLAAGLGEGLRRTGSSLSLVDPNHRLDRVYFQAFGMSVDYRLAGSIRLEAIRVLGASSYPLSNVGDWFLLLLDENQSPAVQSAAIATVGSYSDPAIVRGLIARWPSFTPTLRKQAVAALLSRVERLNTVLDEIDSGRIRPDDLDTTEINLLRTDSDQGVRQRAVRLFGQLTPHRPAESKKNE